ncbi:helix-turn-helix domain-containing protein [Actinomycetospora soli]|uniref:helix-turn-helix domain-containing protein n=1 Tax=Actinomycetospora soli TaxID=2893887 RepID=UPI001E3F16DB|nr:helix-turn-helix transcriptional regulator [Actinomycetospora soli]MCD2187960.1 helix-turn-helix domain-containing protein [Actinomycetospora soli]
MPRPQRELDPAGGPLVEFARDLRALREQAGSPKFATMARRTGRSKTALADASAGRHLPRWETVEDYVRACDADPAPWRARWDALRATLGAPPALPEPVAPDEPAEPAEPAEAAESAERGDLLTSSDSRVPPLTPGADPTPGADLTPGPDPDSDPVERGDLLTSSGSRVPPLTSADPPRTTRTPRRPLLVAAGIVVVALALGFLLGRVTVPDPPVVPQTVEAIEVQNKVALGADRLVEDRTPAYLSTEALSYCASPSRSCKVPGTEMASGAAVVANCWTQGQMMWNVDLADPDQGRNPERAQSDLWYRVSFPDGRTGYLSEVYVVRGDRGGRGLPRCTP